jgi:hypothetical protein
LTPDATARFVAKLEETGSLSEASDAVGLSRNAAYDHRLRDPEFDAACRQALERATDRLERKVRHRAENGSKRGVWYRGEKVGEEREHHDTLSMFMLKAHRPDVYRPDVAAQLAIGLSVETTAKLSDAELELVVGRQLKRDHVIDADTFNVIKDTVHNNDKCAVPSAVQDNAVQRSVVYGNKGPKAPKGGGGRLTQGTQRGPKQQQRSAKKRRSKNKPQK